VTFFDYLSLKTDVNVPSKSNKQKYFEKTQIFCCILSGTDDKNRIKMTWIHNTVWEGKEDHAFLLSLDLSLYLTVGKILSLLTKGRKIREREGRFSKMTDGRGESLLTTTNELGHLFYSYAMPLALFCSWDVMMGMHTTRNNLKKYMYGHCAIVD
jgi:hypothetical protein